MSPAGSDARRRLVALLLARGEIGSAPDAKPDRDGVVEDAEPVDGEAEAPARFERGDSVHRAA